MVLTLLRNASGVTRPSDQQSERAAVKATKSLLRFYSCDPVTGCLLQWSSLLSQSEVVIT